MQLVTNLRFTHYALELCSVSEDANPPVRIFSVGMGYQIGFARQLVLQTPDIGRRRRQFDPSLPEIQADSARLQQVFLNLARNGLQAMEAGGCLTLRTRMTLEHRIVGPDGRPRPTVEIGFFDTGTGIPERIRDRLSTPFFTTKKKGTGLGLSVARHWIRRHGGRMRIESQEGAGARIFVDLPLSPPEADPESGDAGYGRAPVEVAR